MISTTIQKLTVQDIRNSRHWHISYKTNRT